ncbi:MAG: tripartite tricarboxylate transporter substrate binding protein [Hyphomicrobiales bacterium]
MAQGNWPNRPVTMVVGFAAGGGTDVLARILGRRLSEVLGQQVVIENVGGAGGMVGSARVAKAAPDGYTIVMGSRADAINQTLYKKPLYNLLEDLVPVVLIADQPTILITNNDFPANSLPEFIDHVKKNQATLKVASAGAGSTGMIDCQLLNAAIKANVTHVPYRGGGPAMQDIIGGRVDYICTLTGSVVPLVEGKTVKAIAVLTKERAPMLPNVKSSWEQCFTDLEASTRFGFMVPKGTPEPVIERLHGATVMAMEDPEVQKQLLASGAVVVPPTRRSIKYFRDFVIKEIEKNGAPIRAAGLSME